MINLKNFKRNATYLLNIMRKIGIDLNYIEIKTSFEKRLYIQKLVYMLKLHPDFKKYLNFAKYNMYFYGPYSPELAHTYYNLPRNIPEIEIAISNEALEYAREIVEMEIEDLEIAATLVEMWRERGEIAEDVLIRLVYRLKFYLRRSENDVANIFNKIKNLFKKYRLQIT